MDKRRITQVLAAVISNGNINGFIKGNIFRGASKKMCVPGLNCYSCPGALGSCPIGALQSVLGSARYKISLYVIGLMSLFGILMGRFVCGWLCPFGLIQELLHKIPLRKHSVPKNINKYLKYLKYIVLALFVIILPMFLVDEFGMSAPYFCQYICPAGTLEGGIPLVLMNKSLQGAIGFLFAWKVTILVILILLSVIIYRPFCRYLCPLGAFYGMFNKVSFYKYKVNSDKCTSCGKCVNTCKIDIQVYEKPNSAECIRCGECIKACPENAVFRDKIL